MTDGRSGIDTLDDLLARLCDWAAVASFEAGTLSRAQVAITDTLAAIVAGSADAAPAGLAAALGAPGEATVVGRPGGASPATAALINATAAHALDFDDSGTGVLGHASAVLAPALLALAETEGASGPDVATAFVVGVEVQERLGRLANPGHYSRGWHATGTLCALGAAAGAARLLGLGAEGIGAALGIATSLVGGSKVQFGTPIKPIHAGLGARAAVEAALMARVGLAGDPKAMTGRWGFFDLYADVPSASALARAAAGLGERAAIEEGVLQAKRFPCCAAAHKTLDGLEELRQRHGFAPERVAKVETWVPSALCANLRFTRPTSEMQARFSLNYCAARLLDSGALSLADFTPEAVARHAEANSLSRFVMHDIGPADDPMAAPVRTRIHLADGSAVETVVTDAVGGPGNPLTAAVLSVKFADCWRHGGGEGDAADAERAARAITTHSDARAAFHAFCALTGATTGAAPRRTAA